MTNTIGEVVLDTGDGEYFPNLAENYGQIAVGAGLAKQKDYDTWIAAIDRSMSRTAFFGPCNFVTYCMVKPS